MNIHDLIADLTSTLNLTPEQQFRVTAKIKRFVHHEKLSVYCRIRHYSEYGKFNRSKSKRMKNKAKLGAARWIGQFAGEKVEAHLALSNAPDEHIVTWDIGTHRYNRLKS